MKTPHHLRLFTTHLQRLLDQGDLATVLLHTEYERLHSLDPVCFKPHDVCSLLQHLDHITLYCYVASVSSAMETLSDMRAYIERIMMGNLSLLHRFFKTNTDIGSLARLPDLSKAIIADKVYRDL
jgi:hypothetical protein